jgi:hypothetical protein
VSVSVLDYMYPSTVYGVRQSKTFVWLVTRRKVSPREAKQGDRRKHSLLKVI